MKEPGVTFDANTFSEQDLRIVLNRALRSVLVAGLVGIPIIWYAWGWRSMLLFVVGSVIAASGILEWRKLMSAVLARFDPPATTGAGGSVPARPIRGVVFWFVVRLLAAAGLLYVSLRSLDGRVVALLIGLALALFALTIEAFRVFRAWST